MEKLRWGGGGVDEMDIMNQAEVIYDNSCFLYFDVLDL